METDELRLLAIDDDLDHCLKRRIEIFRDTLLKDASQAAISHIRDIPRDDHQAAIFLKRAAFVLIEFGQFTASRRLLSLCKKIDSQRSIHFHNLRAVDHLVKDNRCEDRSKLVTLLNHHFGCNSVFAKSPSSLTYVFDNKLYGANRVFLDPFLGWRAKSLATENINIDDNGCRRSWTPDRPPMATVFFFGGSDIFGSGSPDWETIPSYYAKQFANTGVFLDVKNYGTTGYNSNQEMLQFLLLLKEGIVPDIAIFLDGVNDCMTGMWHPGIAQSHHRLLTMKRKIETWDDK